ncbi:peptidoglycan DD-metalloendopeptidase family protein [Rhodoferax sp.]|jgi:lipoprotein NlpD|uniref:peptidoglycan DD-metalloendopeptidase family protein n=1 Tax=Rhodoferax sp. TaxID=50421 RepID=UPI0037840587
MKCLQGAGAWLCAAVALALAGCGTSPTNRAPVEDRRAAAPQPAVVVPVVKPAAGFENAGRSGYYTVKPGDTLIRIGLENGQSPKDIARWNSLDNPNKIEVGQVLRVMPPVANEAVAVATVKPVASSSVVSTPIAPAAPASAASAPARASSAPSMPAAAAAPSTGDDDLGWIWPTRGPVLDSFDEVKNKGVDIGGVAGEPIFAAADGKVVYAGSGLRNYGNLIILKHNNTYLTAYAHNQTLMVKEDQTVKKGQKIAEMGSSDADRVKLHFELRRLGKAVDPLKYLPPR